MSIVLEWLRTDEHDEKIPIQSLETSESIENLKNIKESFDCIPSDMFLKARGQTNPYENLGKGPFLNRSAMKLANLNHLFNLVQPSMMTSFADLCGGPGGFSEYLLSLTPDLMGFGISLKDKTCDWKVKPSDRFQLNYGADGTGDLLKNENIRAFSKTVGRTVDLVVADGGFQEARNDRNQEEKMQRLILCQVITMFHILNPKGHFVLKTFELASPFSVELIALLLTTFDNVAVVKPITSRPASSERYIVAKNRLNVEIDLRHLLEQNASFKAELGFTQTISKQVFSQLTDIHHALGKAQEKACLAIVQYCMGCSSPESFKRVDKHHYYSLWNVMSNK